MFNTALIFFLIVCFPAGIVAVAHLTYHSCLFLKACKNKFVNSALRERDKEQERLYYLTIGMLEVEKFLDQTSNFKEPQ